MNKILSLQNISKSFIQGGNKLNILNEANLELTQGEMVALVGPSGSGKSTLLQIAGLLDIADQGKIYIDNIECGKASDKARTKLRNKKIGFIYQFHHLLPDFTAIENVTMPLLISGVKQSEAIRKAQQMLKKLGLEARGNHLPSELSGGEQQRIAIARGLINSPSLLLADEPTGNLDPHTSEQVFSIFIEAVKELGLTALIVTHNFELASRMDKRITIVEGTLKDS
jgi:lipoprotein-releasing system ATP-binding protein